MHFCDSTEKWCVSVYPITEYMMPVCHDINQVNLDNLVNMISQVSLLCGEFLSVVMFLVLNLTHWQKRKKSQIQYIMNLIEIWLLLKYSNGKTKQTTTKISQLFLKRLMCKMRFQERVRTSQVKEGQREDCVPTTVIRICKAADVLENCNQLKMPKIEIAYWWI